MKKILFFAFLFFSATAFGQVYDPNNYGIELKSVNANGEATVVVPNGATYIIKVIINPSGSNRGRLTGRGFIMDVPITAQSMEWDVNQGKNVPVNMSFNEAGGFTPNSATAYYVEGYKGADNKMHYSVQQAIGPWGVIPNPANWIRWYAQQPQPICKYVREVNILKTFPTENTQTYTISL